MRHGALVGTIVAGSALLAAATRADETDARLAALESRVDELAQGAGEANTGTTRIHGYGELHYNDLSGQNGAPDKQEIDFHRFVLFFGHEFTERARFNSELEVEHAVTGGDEPGEVEIEQAYLDYDVTDRHTARAGLFLVPVGLLNTTHEPPRFYGVERNPVESAVLPTTWWEAGAGAHGALVGGVNYEAYLHSGLNTSTGSAYSVRSGRQKVAEASASDPAATFALSWARRGVALGGAVQYQADITQGDDARAGQAWLGEVHADLRQGPFGLRALYAEWALDGDGPEETGADRQYGWYAEPSYRLVEAVGVFARYSQWDNQAGGAVGASDKTQTDIGVNWWPHSQVVVKADYQWQHHASGKDQNGINLGLGYEF